MSVSAVARHLGLDRSTIGKYQHLAALPPRTCVRLQPRLLDPFRAYLRDRVLEANPTAPRLLAEIQAMGFTGRKGLVQTYLRQVRAELGFTHPAAGSLHFQTQPAKTLTPRLLQHCVMLPPAHRSSLQERCIEQARRAHPHLDRAIQLTLAFAHALRKRTVSAVPDWIAQATHSGLRAFRTFASSIVDDPAVLAAFTLPFSNGVVEGHVNRLKLIKRKCMVVPTLTCSEQGFCSFCTLPEHEPVSIKIGHHCKPMMKRRCIWRTLWAF